MLVLFSRKVLNLVLFSQVDSDVDDPSYDLGGLGSWPLRRVVLRIFGEQMGLRLWSVGRDNRACFVVVESILPKYTQGVHTINRWVTQIPHRQKYLDNGGEARTRNQRS